MCPSERCLNANKAYYLVTSKIYEKFSNIRKTITVGTTFQTRDPKF